MESICYSQSNIGKFETIKFTDTQNDSTESLFVIMDKPGVTSLISFTRHVGTYNAHTNSCHQFCQPLPYKHCTLPSLRLSFFSNLSLLSLSELLFDAYFSICVTPGLKCELRATNKEFKRKHIVDLELRIH